MTKSFEMKTKGYKIVVINHKLVLSFFLPQFLLCEGTNFETGRALQLLFLGKW